MSERNPTRRQYLLAAGASSIAVLSGCSSGGDDGSGQDENQDTTDGGDGTESSGGDLTPWISGYGTPTKTRSTPDGTPDSLEPKTQYEFEQPIGVTAPAVTESGVFVLGSRIVRVDPSTGETAYERNVPGTGSALFVQDGVVVTGGGTAGTGSRRIVAIDAETGDRAWIAELESGSVPFPAGERIGYVGRTGLGVLDPDTGDHLLEETVQDRINERGFASVVPHPEADTVYLLRAGIDAYSLEDGTRRWHVDMPNTGMGATPTPLAAVGDLVYVGSAANREIVAFDGASGEERFRFEARSTHYAVDTERLYTAPSRGGEITAYDRRDGSELWTTPFTNSMQGLAAAGDALVYVTSNSVRTLSKTTGEQQSSLRLDGVVSSSPPPAFPVAIAGGNIYFTGGVSLTSGMTVF